MKTISESLSYISSLGIFCDSFNKSDNGNLLIQKNIVSSILNIAGGSNKIGYSYPYDMEYSAYCITGNINNTSIYRGNFYYGIATFGSSYVNVDFSNKVVEYVDNTIFQHLRAYSTYLSSLTQTGKKRQASSTYTFTGTSSVSIINLIETDIDKFNLSDILKFIGNNSTIVLNITSTNPITISNKTFEFDGIVNGEVIINVNSPSLNIVGDVYATIFAPNSNVFITNANIHGQLIANNISSTGNNSVYHIPFNYYNKLPIHKLDTPIISVPDTNNSMALITLSCGDIHDEIYYSINESEYAEYNSDISVNYPEDYIISAYTWAYGKESSNIISKSFNIFCECDIPEIIFDSYNQSIYFQTVTDNVKIYYTLDGSTPTINSDNISRNTLIKLDYDGEYIINAFTHNEICSDSGISTKTVYVEYPETGLLMYFDEELVDSTATLYDSDGNGTTVRMEAFPSDAKIRYTIDGSNPMKYGVEYITPFNIKGGKVKAVIYSKNKGYSDIFQSPTIVLGRNIFIEKSDIANNLEVKNKEYEPYARFGQDMGWYGPLVLSDDTAIYQALVNILSTSIMEIPFRPTFGTSLKNRIFELSAQLSSDDIIVNLKSEIEMNDPRINVDRNNSYAYYDDGGNALIIYLEWTSKLTGEKGRIKYDYSLDGIL